MQALVRFAFAGQYHRAFGRFHVMRRAWSLWRAAQQHWRRAAASAPKPTLFADLDIELCVAQLRLTGIAAGLVLPEDLTAEILRFARSACCAPPGSGQTGIAEPVERIASGRLSNGVPLPVADVCRAAECPEVVAICADPVLAQVAGQYLGYHPERLEFRLLWSFAADFTDDERRRGQQTIDFHYDIGKLNTVYLYFYITDVDRHNGAHVVLRGSHRNKPVRMLFSSAFRPEPDVIGYYGREAETIVEGPAGYGFFEDPACFHKALPPRSADRLMLQIRYS